MFKVHLILFRSFSIFVFLFAACSNDTSNEDIDTLPKNSSKTLKEIFYKHHNNISGNSIVNLLESTGCIIFWNKEGSKFLNCTLPLNSADANHQSWLIGSFNSSIQELRNDKKLSHLNQDIIQSIIEYLYELQADTTAFSRVLFDMEEEELRTLHFKQIVSDQNMKNYQVTVSNIERFKELLNSDEVIIHGGKIFKNSSSPTLKNHISCQLENNFDPAVFLNILESLQENNLLENHLYKIGVIEIRRSVSHHHFYLSFISEYALHLTFKCTRVIPENQLSHSNHAKIEELKVMFHSIFNFEEVSQ